MEDEDSSEANSKDEPEQRRKKSSQKSGEASRRSTRQDDMSEQDEQARPQDIEASLDGEMSLEGSRLAETDQEDEGEAASTDDRDEAQVVERPSAEEDLPDTKGDRPPTPSQSRLLPSRVADSLLETGAEGGTSKIMSSMSMDTANEEKEDEEPPEQIQFEWAAELDEYDEPDVYPSEKDYKWVEELVEASDEEELPDADKPIDEAAKSEDAGGEEAPKAAEPQEGDGPQLEKKEGESTTAEETQGEGKDVDVEEGFEAATIEAEPEPEPEPEPPKKKFKKILVKKLVERPPKIHYVPEQVRADHVSSDPDFFVQTPFNLVDSFGYDSQRMANLHVLDEKTLVYMTGYVLTFLDHTTMNKFYLSCLGGSGFGALAVHPSRRLFAAAEKGKNPVIGIWSWPKLQLFRQLREGTNKVYASINFSPNGTLLASQGGEPDYLITVWNWHAEMPVLRVKSHAQDVFRVTFSKELAGRLTTSGLCHIKFWKMAHTFTGLKLKGDIGRFGRTELSDIEGYVEMPDGKVLSGSEWGNLLVWENGLIIAELCLRVDYPCHDGIVRQVLLTDGEFYTTGQDGWVKTWNFDAVDTSEINTTEDSIKVPIKVMAQVQIADGADIWSIVPNVPNPYSNSVYWFAQDGAGTIWKVDLSFLNTAKDPVKISTAHGGPIVACQTCSTNYLFATLGHDGQIRVYDYISKELLAHRKFSAPGSSLLWPSPLLDETGMTILAGFTDGTFRVLALSGTPNKHLQMSVTLLNVKKPHNRKITSMALDSDGQYFVTGGEDGTIFFFDAKQNFLPMVFVAMPEYRAVSSVTWFHKNQESNDRAVLVVLGGAVLQEVIMPEWDQIHNETSYLFMESKMPRRYAFHSIKSQLRHNEELERERQEEEARQAALEEENRIKIADGLESQSEQDLRLLQEAEEMERFRLEEKPKPKWQPYYPPESSPIVCMIPGLREEEMYISMGKFDAGYIYHVKISNKHKDEIIPEEPISAFAVEDSDDVPITSYAMSNDGEYIIFGFEDGRIRYQRYIYSYDLENLGPHWTKGIHDCVRGSITSLAIDMTGSFLVTCGKDGNCFLLGLLEPEALADAIQGMERFEVPEVEAPSDVQDITEKDAYTLETFKNMEKEMALLAAAKRNKAAKKEEIVRLRLLYCEILKKNNELPEESRLTKVEVCIASDNQARKEKELAESMKQLELEMAWDTERSTIALNKLKSAYKDTLDGDLFMLKAFNSDLCVSSFRLPKMPPFYLDAKDKVEHQTTPRAIESDILDDDLSSHTSSFLQLEPRPKRKVGMDKFIHQRLVRLWERKQRKVHRQQVWKEFMATEPKGKELREEDKAIEKAMANMGDMKLKMAVDYKVPEEKKLTEHRARKKLVYLEEIIFSIKKQFNLKMLTLREQKVQYVKRMNEYRRLIEANQAVLPAGEIIKVPHVEPMALVENPHSYMDYSEEDIKIYKKQIEEKMKAAAAQAVTKLPKKAEVPVKRKQFQTQNINRRGSSSTKVGTKERSEEFITRTEEGHDLGNYVEEIVRDPTPLELLITKISVEKARFYQRYYSQLIEVEKFAFDVKLKIMRHRKLRLEYLLKIADERMVLLTDEFILAQRSEAMEASIELKIVESNREKKECSSHVKVLMKKQDIIKKDIDACAKQKAALLAEVTQIAIKAPGFEKYLTRVFNKKLAKPSKVPTVDVSSDPSLAESDEESESSSDMDIEDEDEDDDGLDVDLPPSELNKDVYDQVVEVRLKRFAVDETEAAARESYDEVTASINTLKTKIKEADKSLDSGKRDLEAFIKEKQSKQNNLDCAVSLKLNQIFVLDADLKEALCTGHDTIQQLRNRIPELRREMTLQKRKGQEIKKQHFQLQQEKHKFLLRLEVMKKRCDTEMLKKFGAVTAIEDLENFTIDPDIKVLQKDLEKEEDEHGADMVKLTSIHRRAIGQRVDEMNKQAERMYGKAEMLQQVNEMTKEMDEQMRNLPTEYEDVTTRKEIKFLSKVVRDQQRIINTLKMEITRMTSRRVTPLPPITRAQ